MPKKKKKQQKRLYAGVISVFAVLLIGGLFFNARHVGSTPDLPRPALKELAAEKNIKLGNHAILNRIGEKPYSDILSTQFDFVLADNTPNWYFTDGGLRPSETTYNWKQMDQVMDYAAQHN